KRASSFEGSAGLPVRRFGAQRQGGAVRRGAGTERGTRGELREPCHRRCVSDQIERHRQVPACLERCPEHPRLLSGQVQELASPPTVNDRPRTAASWTTAR